MLSSITSIYRSKQKEFTYSTVNSYVPMNIFLSHANRSQIRMRIRAANSLVSRCEFADFAYEYFPIWNS